MQLVDTHCHIHEAASAKNPARSFWKKDGSKTAEAMVLAAAKAGVTQMVCVGTTAADSQRAVEFAQNHPSCWASIGLHPHDAQDGQKAIKQLEKLAARPKVVAVGECGLDYFYNNSPKDQQLKMLHEQIKIAALYKLPLIFHVRDAFADFWPVFDSYSGLKGVLHSYTDSQSNLEKALQRGLYIGVNGIATFAKDPAQIAMYKAIPLGSMLLETDSPFLTPHPYRGTVNEPAQVSTVAKFLAELRGEDLPQIASATTKNALTLLKLKKSQST